MDIYYQIHYQIFNSIAQIHNDHHAKITVGIELEKLEGVDFYSISSLIWM